MIKINRSILKQIHAYVETNYPEEGAGFLLGTEMGDHRQVVQIFMTENAREDRARYNRYLVSPQDYLQAEIMGETLGLNLIGVFHSHPDHPNHPSQFDLEWAQPYFSYVITSVRDGSALDSRSWRLSADRKQFEEEMVIIDEKE